jgi:hypothetical protein
MLRLITVTPWSRINDRFLDGTIPYVHPDHDITHPLMRHDGGANSTRFHGNFYRNIALDLVSETVFNYPYPCITEKTLRPIANQRMFVIMGAAGTLSVLRDWGFKTWSDIIDESYDNITDPCDRFKAIMHVIRNFCQLDLDVVKQYLQDNQDRLQHNLITLRHLRDHELRALDQRLSR